METGERPCMDHPKVIYHTKTGTEFQHSSSDSSSIKMRLPKEQLKPFPE